jgi:hypothetical protein
MNHAKAKGQVMSTTVAARSGSSEREKPPTYNRLRRVVTVSLSPLAAAAMSRSAAWRANAGNVRRVFRRV